VPGIGSVEVLSSTEGRSLEESHAEHLSRLSNDGRFELRLSRPSEIGMGASTWSDLKLIEDRQGVAADRMSGLHVDGMSLARLLFHYPWDHRSRCLALPFIRRSSEGWVYRVASYDVEDRVVRYQLDDTWAAGLVWSPTADVLLVVRPESSELVSIDGIRIPIDTASNNRGRAAWTPSGSSFVLFPPCADNEQERVCFFDTSSRRLVNEEPLDPLHLLPFDSERLRAESRGHVLTYPTDSGGWDSTSCFDSLMLHWIDAVYDPCASALALSTFRPLETLEPHEEPHRSNSVNLSAGASVYRTHHRPGSDRPKCAMNKAWVRVSFID
jgi:hypothetical protein